MKTRNLCLSLLAGFVLAACGSCKKDDPKQDEKAGISTPSELKVALNESAGTATVIGRADAGAEVTLKYEGERGGLLRKVQADASGNFSLTVDQLVGYEQALLAFASKGDEVSASAKVPKIAAKAAYAGGWADAKELMLARRWKSDQTVSRVITRQTADAPPYQMFATVAQKYFDFKADGAFHFEVTQPVQFAHTAGTWAMDDNGVITISTQIPMGPMQIKNAKIQHLDADRLTLLAEISDGLFLLSLTK